MEKQRTYYDVLRVSPDAEGEVIQAAYRTLMAKLKKHPDLGGDATEAALINRAYAMLSDPADRAAYDAFLRRARTISTARLQPEPSGEERRRVPRHEVDATVSYCVEHDTIWHAARVRDVSVLGMRLQSHDPLSRGEHVVISPANPVASAVHGTIRWARMFHPSIFERIYEAGIEFSDQISDIDDRLSL